MKTTLNNSNILNGLKTLVVLAVAITSINTNTLKAQNSCIGFSVKANRSMGGLGSTITPQITYIHNRHEVQFGMNVQAKHSNISGLRAGYNFVINPDNDNQVFMFADVNYMDKAYLNNYALKLENTINPENGGYFQSVRISSVEHHIGFGVKFFNNGPINCFAAIGGGFYTTVKMNEKRVFGYRDLKDASVMISFGINVKIANLGKSHLKSSL